MALDVKGLFDKAKAALKGNPDLIEKGGDAIDKATGGKYAGQVDKAQDAVRKTVGAEEKKAPEAAPAPQATPPAEPEPPKA